MALTNKLQDSIFNDYLIKTDIIRAIRKILTALLIIICAIPFVSYVWLQFPSVQTNIARNALSSVNDSINGTISLDRITIVFFNKLIAYDLSIIGQDNDTLAHVGKLSVSLSTQDILTGKLALDRIVVEDALFSLRTYDSQTGDNNISRIFGVKQDTTESRLDLPDMQARSIILKNVRFNLVNTSDPLPGRELVVIEDPRCFDYRNIGLTDINVRLHRIRYTDGVLTCRIRDLSVKDRCGYEVQSLSGFFAMDSTETSIQNLVLIDSYSKVKANYLSFGYESGKDLQEYTQKIVMGGDFVHTSLDFRSIGVFAQALRDNDLLLDVHGEIIGPVRDLQSKGLKLKYKDSTTLDLDIRLTGLPKIKNTVFTATFHDVTTNGQELEEIIEDFTNTGTLSKKARKAKEGQSSDVSSLSEILPHRRFTLKGEYLGTIYDGHSEGTVTLGHSSIGYVATILDHFNANGFDIDASLDIDDLNAGEIIDAPILGEVSLDATAHINIGKDRYGGGLSFDIDTIAVSKADINGYTYRDIAVCGQMDDGTMDLRLYSDDDAFPAIVRASASFSKEMKPENIKAYIDIPHADLKKANIVTKHEYAASSILAQADITVGPDNLLLGTIMMDSIIYANNHGRFMIDSLDVYSYMKDSLHCIELHSPILTGFYASDGHFKDLVARLRTDIVETAFPEAFAPQTAKHSTTEAAPGDSAYYRINLTTRNMTKVSQVVTPGLHIADNSTIDLTLDQDSGLDFSVLSKYVVFNTNKFKDISVNLDNRDSVLKADFYIDDLSLGNTPLRKSRISAAALADGLHIHAGFSNPDNSELDLNAVVNLDRTVSKALSTTIGLGHSVLNIKGHKWELEPSTISLAPHHYRVDSVFIHNQSQSLAINGVVSEDEEDVLKVDFSDFDISLFNSFGKRNLGFYGHISGDVELSDIFASTGLTLSLDGDDIIIFDREFGDITVASRWDEERQRFNVMLNNRLNGRNPINASGYFIPKQSYMDLNLSLDNLQTYYITPIIENAAEISEGTVTGDINISGKFNELTFIGNDIVVNSVKLTPQFTKVPYSISGLIDLHKSKIDLKKMQIVDPNGATATLNGTIGHKSLKDFDLDLGLTFHNLLAINTKEHENNIVYGTAYASGVIDLTGPLNDLKINLNVATADNTAIHVPMSSSSSASTTDLILFNNFASTSKTIDIDKYIDSLVSQKVKPKKKSNIQITGHANINQSTELFIELNKQLGDILRCRGNGSIDMNISPSRNILDLRGDYKITDGNYHFTAMGIVSRDFTLNDGGSIMFNGDIKNTELDVKATYRTKTSISTLIADTTSVGNRRNVNCTINLAGSLSNPQLGFGIQIPDLDPITKGMAESALSTPDKVQRQFMSLLISGSFVPDEQSSIVNNSSLLLSNASEILSNQFNNIFRQLEIPIDLGLNYQHDQTSGKDMFDVAISYQALNNRLIINGNVGNSKTSSSWTGDLEVELKVDKQGKLRVSLFTRAADSYTNYLDNTQRSGFGVSFQDEFDTFGEFIRSIFHTKKRKDRDQLERIRAIEQELLEEAQAKAKAAEGSTDYMSIEASDTTQRNGD